jgi:peroxiredoxin Q/BCP
MPRFVARAAFAAIAFVFVTFPLAADDSVLKVKEGDKFPDVPLPAAQIDKVKPNAKTISVSDLKGKTVVIFFYPAAGTKSCTTECNGFRDLVNEFPKDVVVLGASSDIVSKQQEFIDAHKLPMVLLADTDLKLTRELGILGKAGGRTSKRATFVVNKEGKIAKIYEPGKIDVNKHPKEVLEFVKTLK